MRRKLSKTIVFLVVGVVLWLVLLYFWHGGQHVVELLLGAGGLGIPFLAIKFTEWLEGRFNSHFWRMSHPQTTPTEGEHGAKTTTVIMLWLVAIFYGLFVAGLILGRCSR